MEFEKAIPIFYSADIPRSLNYYTQTLNFDKSWEWDKPATFGGVRKGETEIFFCKEDQGNPGTWIYVTIENVDQYFEEIRARGAIIIQEPANRDWNMREMLVEDPDGHIIRFGHRIECD